jgi:alpha-D-ribose 1-methylphosphonate 5-triphosphate diphosphatase
MVVVMGGPNLVRGGSYSGNVPASVLVQEGLLEAFASDYVPRSLIECAFILNRPEFGWSLSQAVRTVTATAARAAGLSDRGEVAEGLRADMLRVKPVQNLPILRGVWAQGVRVA